MKACLHKNKSIILIFFWLSVNACNVTDQPQLTSPTGQIYLHFENPYNRSYSKVTIELANKDHQNSCVFNEQIGPTTTVVRLENLHGSESGVTSMNSDFSRSLAIPSLTNDSYKILIERGHRTDSATIHYNDNYYVLESHTDQLIVNNDTIKRIKPSQVWISLRKCEGADSNGLSDLNTLFARIGCVPDKWAPGNYGHFTIGMDSLPIAVQQSACDTIIQIYSYQGDISQLTKMEESYNRWHDPNLRIVVHCWDGVVP